MGDFFSWSLRKIEGVSSAGKTVTFRIGNLAAAESVPWASAGRTENNFRLTAFSSPTNTPRPTNTRRPTNTPRPTVVAVQVGPRGPQGRREQPASPAPRASPALRAFRVEQEYPATGAPSVPRASRDRRDLKDPGGSKARKATLARPVPRELQGRQDSRVRRDLPDRPAVRATS